MFSQTGGKKEMKKLWIVLLSLAMVAAFCMPASAVDVKFSGSYYVAGDYYSDLDVYDDDQEWAEDQPQAFFRQRLRVQTEFVVSPGLSLITRFDALEKIWGDNNWAGRRGNTQSRPHYSESADEAGSKEQENIEFEQAYIQYMSKVGMWWIGYAPHDFWGTTFGDSTQTQALVQWILPMKWGMIGAKYFKTYEGNGKFNNEANSDYRGNDTDDSAYVGIAMFKNQEIETGLKVAYRRLANNKDFGQNEEQGQYSLPGKVEGWLLTPYFIGQWGPFKVQAEVEYWNGTLENDDDFDYGNAAPFLEGDDIDMEMWAAYVDGTFNIGPGYVGARFIYASGQDYSDPDEISGSNFTAGFEGCWGGIDLKQTLILWNEDVTLWQTPNWSQGPGVKNALFYQIYGGYKWQDFDFFASFAYAEADEAYAYGDGFYEVDDDDYGYELDVTVSYNITNNLKYMVGAGYLWTGDYFKGKSKDGYDGVDVDDIYLLTNKLTLTF